MKDPADATAAKLFTCDCDHLRHGGDHDPLCEMRYAPAVAAELRRMQERIEALERAVPESPGIIYHGTLHCYSCLECRDHRGVWTHKKDCAWAAVRQAQPVWAGDGRDPDALAAAQKASE